MAPVFQPPGLENLDVVVVVVHCSEKTHLLVCDVSLWYPVVFW